jgi:hypothetical protein
MSLAQEFTPDLADTVDAVVFLMDLLDECGEFRWRAVNAPHLVALVRAGARFERGLLGERPEEAAA